MCVYVNNNADYTTNSMDFGKKISKNMNKLQSGWIYKNGDKP